MKKILILILISNLAFAQNIAKTDTGTINGAAFELSSLKTGKASW